MQRGAKLVMVSGEVLQWSQLSQFHAQDFKHLSFPMLTAYQIW